MRLCLARMRFSLFLCRRSSSLGGLMPAASSALGHGPRNALIATTSRSEKSDRLGKRSQPSDRKRAYFACNKRMLSSLVSFCSAIIPPKNKKRLFADIQRKSVAIPCCRKKADSSLRKRKNGYTFHIQKCCGNRSCLPSLMFGEYSDL